MSNLVGFVSKMKVCPESPVHYQLPLSDHSFDMNAMLGSTFALRFTGQIQCIACERSIKKTFNQGYCFPCSQKLARCDICILKPETCHYHLGTCREPQWGETHCMIPHVVYLSVTSDLKVGITRKSQIPTRWFDQGATLALPLLEVPTRRISGFMEDVLREHLKDKTNWRTLLKQDNPVFDLVDISRSILKKSQEGIEEVKGIFGEEGLKMLEPKLYTFRYPVLEYPTKIKSLSFDKQDLIEGKLIGIKGQYLLFDTGVINIRKFTGYELKVIY